MKPVPTRLARWFSVELSGVDIIIVQDLPKIDLPTAQGAEKLECRFEGSDFILSSRSFSIILLQGKKTLCNFSICTNRQNQISLPCLTKTLFEFFGLNSGRNITYVQVSPRLDKVQRYRRSRSPTRTIVIPNWTK